MAGAATSWKRDASAQLQLAHSWFHGRSAPALWRTRADALDATARTATSAVRVAVKRFRSRRVEVMDGRVVGRGVTTGLDPTRSVRHQERRLWTFVLDPVGPRAV